MVKKTVILFSALALMVTMVSIAGAQFAPIGFATTGDTIMIPMKVKTTFKKVTIPQTVSSFFSEGCQQYGDFRPWGGFRATKCTMKTQVIPPKCVMPGQMDVLQMSAPVLGPGCKLVKNEEKWSQSTPGCNPCVSGGSMYELVRKQVVK